MSWLEGLHSDVAYAWRTTRRSPGLTAIVVLTLALGIGANAATFSLLDRLYLRPPGGLTDPATLKRIWVEHFRTSTGVPFKSQAINYPTYQAIAAATGGRERMALFTTDNALRLGKRPSDPRVRVVYATSNYFAVLGVRPAFGRIYTADEDRLGGGSPVAVVSHAFWRTRLAGDPGALGRTIPIGKNIYTVVGIADPRFTALDLQAADVWIPIASMPGFRTDVPWWTDPNATAFFAVRRADPALADAEFDRRATAVVREMNRREGVRGDTLKTVHTGSIIEARGPARPGQELVIATRLGGVAIIVLLIAGANVINLLLARAVRRRREIALRLALGVSRSRLVRMLTAEAVLLASLAGVASMFAAWWGGALLRGVLMPEIEWSESTLDTRVVAFTVLVTLMAGLVAGIIPAFQASNPRLSNALKAGAREGGPHRSRLRTALVVIQAALSVVLLVGATLFVRSLRNVQSLDIGYDADRLLFGRVQFVDGERPPRAVLGAAMRDVAARLRGQPGIEAVARAGVEPMRGFSTMNFFTGADSAATFGRLSPTGSVVSPSFFEATGLRILRGSRLSGDDVDGAPAEVVVNDAMAKLVWPRGDAIGQCVRFEKRENPCYTVVGVVETARAFGVIENEAAAQYYLPLGNMPTESRSGTTLIVRATADAAAIATRQLRLALQRAFPAADASVVPMMTNLEPEYRPWRLGATLFTAIGLLAFVVAVIGIYSTVSYGVTQRTHEFGVRVALGAQISDVLRQVAGEGMRTVAVGAALGIVLVRVGGKLIAALLYGVGPSDPVIVAFVVGALLAVAAVAALVPAWRAARIDPITALRTE